MFYGFLLGQATLSYKKVFKKSNYMPFYSKLYVFLFTHIFTMPVSVRKHRNIEPGRSGILKCKINLFFFLDRQ